MNNKITYHKVGDYHLPNLYLTKDEYEKDYQIGKYGHLRLEHLKTHKKAKYTIMFMDNTLRKHIVDTDKQAKERFEILISGTTCRQEQEKGEKKYDYIFHILIYIDDYLQIYFFCQQQQKKSVQRYTRTDFPLIFLRACRINVRQTLNHQRPNTSLTAST